MDPHKPFTPVVVADAGNAAAAILAQPQRHTNKTYKVISNRHTFSDVAAAFSQSLGKEVKYNRVSYEEAKRALIKSGSVDWKADGVLGYYKLIDEGSPVINEKDLSQYEHITAWRKTYGAEDVGGQSRGIIQMTLTCIQSLELHACAF